MGAVLVGVTESDGSARLQGESAGFAAGIQPAGGGISRYREICRPVYEVGQLGRPKVGVGGAHWARVSSGLVCISVRLGRKKASGNAGLPLAVSVGGMKVRVVA